MCGTLVRIWLSTGMKPRSVTTTPAFSAEIFFPLGARPTLISTASYGCGSFGAFGPSNVTHSASGFASTAVVRVDVMMRSNRRLLTFSHTRTRSRSAPGIRPSSISTTSRRAPSDEYTVPISSPMMPPPITSIRFGTDARSSAPVESSTRGSSGMNGSRTTCEPAAMIACANFTTFLAPDFACPVPSVTSTSTWCASRNWPTPRTTSTLRDFAMPARPPVSLPTTLSFQPRSLTRSTCGAPNAMPCSASDSASSITAATCSSAFDGMQPTLRHTPPSCA